jgi:hypothetical protein
MPDGDGLGGKTTVSMLSHPTMLRGCCSGSRSAYEPEIEVALVKRLRASGLLPAA